MNDTQDCSYGEHAWHTKPDFPKEKICVKCKLETNKTQDWREKVPCLNQTARKELKEKFRMELPEDKGCGCENCNLRLWVEKEISLAVEKEKQKSACPPHNMADYHFTGAWGGTQPPPNKKCTKCLLETNF